MDGSCVQAFFFLGDIIPFGACQGEGAVNASYCRSRIVRDWGQPAGALQ